VVVAAASSVGRIALDHWAFHFGTADFSQSAWRRAFIQGTLDHAVTTLDDILWALALDRAATDPAPTNLLRDLLWRSLHRSGWRSLELDIDNPLTFGSDRSLLAQFVHGDPEAFEMLVERHGGVLLGFARRSLPHEHADDAVLAAFLVMFSKVHQVIAAADRNVRGFLFRATRLEVRKHLGQRLRDEGSLDAMVAALAPDGPDVLERLRAREPLELAALLLATCDSLEQEAMLLRLAGRPVAEIAATLELEPGHVRVIEHRASTKLAAALDGGSQ
jgi:RNA polymerase sigma factor (sigma-70 family)